MIAALAVVAVAVLVALAVVLVQQRRMAERMVAAGQRLAPDVAADGNSLGAATEALEQAVERSLARRQDTSAVEARLTSALSAIPQGIVLFDPAGEAVFHNRSAVSELDARHEVALLEEAVGDLAAEVIDGRAAATGRTIELFGPPRRILALRAVAVPEVSGEVGALVVIDDITERRRLEAVRRDFVANISHELKTPVAALGLLAETLVSEDDPALARRLGERMLDEAFRVARTIEDLLELSRIESTEAVVREDVPVAEVVAEAVDRVRAGADGRGIELQVAEVAADLRVVGDRRQLVSAVYNLLDNAVKYSDQGSPVGLAVRRDGAHVDIVVTDAGTGIPARDLDRIFERFYRVDRARSRGTGGTGLGLAIVRNVAGNHGGEVRVESREGEGSTFTLRLPLAEGGVVTREAG